LHKWHNVQGVAVFQLAGEREAFIVDMIKLKGSNKLDKMLKNIFSHKHSNIVGFGFHSDIAMFRKSLPKMSFYQHIENFMDA
jgi:hypothetical protein